MSAFFEELKRRKVYRVAVAYGVVAWLVIQISATVFPAWELPSWSLRLVIVAVLTGFPIALILAWAFDVTPSGIERTSKVETQAPAANSRRRRNVILLALTGVVISLVVGFLVMPRASARKIEKSIAVLPFENLSDDKENAYFADGIQDDILTSLSKIGDLKVISRTSVMPYRGHASNVREIGKALGASAILEGSVRRSEKRVRVNVQLINAETDEHIWAQDYDRDLTDVFAIQSDLAHEIASALQAKLSPTEKALMDRKPTQNTDAYLLYVQAHDLFTLPDKRTTDLYKAEELFQRAIQLDPNFALAYAQLSTLESWLVHSVDPSPARRQKARTAADAALRLQPDLPEAHLGLGYSYYYGDRDYEKALAEFAIAQRGLPNDAEVYVALAAIERRQGKWKESTANFEKAASLSPKDATVLENLGINYEATRNFEAADKIFDEGIAAAPHSFNLRGLKAKLALDWKGDFSVGEKMLAKVPPGMDPDGIVSMGRMSILILQRKFPEALEILQRLPMETLHDEGGGAIPKTFLEGTLYCLMGEKSKGREALERARVALEKSIQDTPDDANHHAILGDVFAELGRKEEAIREGKRAVELLPEAMDAFDGPTMTITLAQIYAWTGESDLALQLIEHSLTTPAGITVPILKLDPVWDPIRNDPRFQLLLTKYGGSA
ncbi:MAG TPA: tetratricopeptide repeat protein [Chthoniobacterales bacterium]